MLRNLFRSSLGAFNIVPAVSLWMVCMAVGSTPQQLHAQELMTDLQARFIDPPDDTKPGCYWYWINDNISKEGITRDLEAMARVGIGRAYIGHIFNHDTPEETPPGTVKFMDDEWWTALQWAVKEADRCGVDIGFFNSPGWSQSGAPWIKPSESMRYLGHSETSLTGGQTIDTILTVPDITTFPNRGGSVPIRTGPNFTAADFQDVRVIAYQNNHSSSTAVLDNIKITGSVPDLHSLTDQSDKTFLSVKPSSLTTFTISLDSPQPVQNILVKPLDYGFTLTCNVEASDDRSSFTALTTYQEERGHQGPKNLDPIIVPIPQTTASQFLVTLQFNAGRDIRISEIALSNEALLAGYVRKQLGETSPHTQPAWNSYVWPDQADTASGSAIVSRDVLDLTNHMDSNGRLVWTAPEGHWTVLRMGMIPIGTQSAPASDESRGLEVDKLSKQHIVTLFNGMVGEFIKRTPVENRKALKYVIADSYETGPQNWTDELMRDFETKFGYSPVRFLPVMTGRVVDSPDISNRFLWDLRQWIVESVATNYVGGLREISHQNGLKLWLENYGHWGFISEFLLYGSETDEVGGEFWESSDPISNVECRAAASSAHIYGKTDVYAEGFTSGRNFQQTPATLKKWCDWAFGTGINHLILHVYIHQPLEEAPGIIQWFGTAFNRHNTWFDQSKSFINYMRRGAVLLKAGKPVADVAYYIGENSPSMQGPMDPPLPNGYDFDNVNSDVLIHRATVKDGKLCLKDGPSYSVLVLPKITEMRPEVAHAIRKLIEDGAIVAGPRPERSPSLQNYPSSDKEVENIAREVWGEVGQENRNGRQFGKGWIYDGVSLEQILEKHNITPDVNLVKAGDTKFMVAGTGKLGVGPTGGLLFKHRQADNVDIYFLSNTSDSNIDTTVSFRQAGIQPEFWNAVTGEISSVTRFDFDDDNTQIPVALDASQSIFVVFDKAKVATTSAIVPVIPQRKMVLDLSENWSATFKGIEAPSPMHFQQLTDWSQSQDSKVANFSGTTIYKKKFPLADLPEGKLLLNLGKVNVLGTVIVNGKEVGTVWTTPWEIDVTQYLQKGTNAIEIHVTNTWNNRLVADAKRPADDRSTSVSQAYHPNPKQPRMPSGLEGPVALIAETMK